MTTAAELRAVIIAELSRERRTSFQLAELAGLEWDGAARRKVHKAIVALRNEGFDIYNIGRPGSHRGGEYVLTLDPECGAVRVSLPRRRCGTPGCITYLARDHILNGALYCSACMDRKVYAGCMAILGEHGQQEMAV